MSLDDQALKDHYSDHPVDLSWLNKPSQHVFRWRNNDNRWLTAKRRVRDHASFLKAIGKSAPRDVYVSTASCSNEVNAFSFQCFQCRRRICSSCGNTGVLCRTCAS